jgi:hypothetical protein
MAGINRTNNHCVLGQFLVETLLDRAVEVKVQRLCRERQRGGEQD